MRRSRERILVYMSRDCYAFNNITIVLIHPRNAAEMQSYTAPTMRTSTQDLKEDIPYHAADDMLCSVTS